VCVDAFGNDEFLKVWKGLHYCMWMTDKPLIQVLHIKVQYFRHCWLSVCLSLHWYLHWGIGQLITCTYTML